MLSILRVIKMTGFWHKIFIQIGFLMNMPPFTQGSNKGCGGS